RRAAWGGRGQGCVGGVPGGSLAVFFSFALLIRFVGRGGRAGGEPRALCARLRDGGENVGIGCELQRRPASVGLLLQFLRGLVGSSPVGDRTEADRDVGRNRCQARAKQILGGISPHLPFAPTDGQTPRARSQEH